MLKNSFRITLLFGGGTIVTPPESVWSDNPFFSIKVIND